MRLFLYCAFLVLLIYKCLALTCRSANGPKDEEIKKVFNKCLNNNNNDAKESQQKERNGQNRDGMKNNQWNSNNRNDDMRAGYDYSGTQDRQTNKNHRENRNDRSDNGRYDSGYNTNGGKEDKRSSSYGMDTENRMNQENNMRAYNRNDHLTGQDEFLQSEEFGDASRVNHFSPQPTRRYKRETPMEMNSGKRSQYNPHSHRSSGYENNNTNKEKNTSDNSSKEIDKACVLHCMLENLHMTDDGGMPDRYLVTHALTKDEKNEDLRDFLQESIEECFQILDNENTENKCEFSKNLLTCLSEKGRTNCDDWNGKTGFMF